MADEVVKEDDVGIDIDDPLYTDVRQLDEILYAMMGLSEKIKGTVHEDDEPFWQDIQDNIEKAWENTDYFKASMEEFFREEQQEE